MNKRRWVAMVAFSPILLVMLTLIVFASCISYAVNGKWELREFINQYRTS